MTNDEIQKFEGLAKLVRRLCDVIATVQLTPDSDLEVREISYVLDLLIDGGTPLQRMYDK